MAEKLSVLRSENKYLINLFQAKSIQERLEQILDYDENAQDGPYIVRSLYFDSINQNDLNEKFAGTQKRKKIRLRVYGPEDTQVKLEMKQKDGDQQKKISLIITKEEANELIDGNFYVLVKHFDDPHVGLVAKHIYTTMTLGCYRPAVMIEYDRLAFIHPTHDTRITFDMNIRSSETNFDLFDENISYMQYYDNTIVFEVKYNGVLPSFISGILKPYHLTRLAVSKYVTGRKAFIDFYY